MDKEMMQHMFDKFCELYKRNELKIFFGKNSYSLSIKNNDILKEEEKEDFNKFCSDFISCLREKVVDKEYNEEYDEFVEEFLKQNRYMESEVITKVKSNLNIIHSIENEILTKRDKELKENSFSVLANINFRKPTYREIKLEQISFELSLQDLEIIQKKIEKIFRDINSLSK